MTKEVDRTPQPIGPTDTPATARTPGVVAPPVNLSLSVEAGQPQTSVVYGGAGGEIELRFDPTDQAIWATAQNIANLFDTDISVVRRHIANVYKDEELQEVATSAKFALVQMEGGRSVIRPAVSHYNLDVVLSVGYRVSAKRAVQFRQWATATLRTYLEQGYVINEKALRESPEKLNRLAAQVRALRSEEKQVYAKVRECFKLCSSDYDPSSQQVRTFYALLQDKFHHAVTQLTSSKLVMDRADHLDTNMGMHSFKGEFPTMQEAQIGKNYLHPEELYRLHLLSEQFLLFAESTALAKRPMTMQSLHEQLDRLLTLNGYPIFDGYQDFIKDEAIRHARREHALFKKRTKIEAMGIIYDEDALVSGDYDELLIDNQSSDY